MLQQYSRQRNLETCIESRAAMHTVSAQHTPRQNHLLAMLPREEYERLKSNLEPVFLRQGATVHDAGEQEKYLHFITAGIVCRFYTMKNGAAAEFAVTGNEGVIGIASFLGGKTTPNQAVVLSAGHAYRLRADRLKNEFKHGGQLLPLLLRYTMALITQTGQSAVCNRHHSMEQQLCRWILTCLDCLPSNDLTMTQGLIANMLGVRRESVTEAAGKLQQAGLIHYSRGHIAVLDRPRLEAQVCECYAVVKHEYDRLLPQSLRPGLEIGDGSLDDPRHLDHYTNLIHRLKQPKLSRA